MSSVRIELVRGDITTQDVDAVVNAANSSLLGGGGVDGAIHAAAGPEVLRACRELRASTLPGGLPTGDAVATTAGRLPARWIIHTVGPVYARERDPAALLAAAYGSSLRVADELGARSVAFPAVSTGVYGYPLAEAAVIALRTVVEAGAAGSGVELARFVLFGDAAFDAFRRAAADLRIEVAPGPDTPDAPL